MNVLPKALQSLVDHFDKLPGIGPKHATRLALHLLNRRELGEKIAADISEALASLRFCEQCMNISDTPRCLICADPSRDQTVICVVAHVQDIEPVERTGKYTGTYHILHGMLNPIEGVTPDDVRIKELTARLGNQRITEVILALDSTAEGEATALYLTNILKSESRRITRLGRGIPAGSSIEYTDEATLTSALENRR